MSYQNYLKENNYNQKLIVSLIWDNQKMIKIISETNSFHLLGLSKCKIYLIFDYTEIIL